MRRSMVASGVALTVLFVAACGGGDKSAEIDELRSDIGELRKQLSDASSTPTATAAIEPRPLSTPIAGADRQAGTPDASATSESLEAVLTRYIADTGGDGISLRTDCADTARLDGGWADATEVRVAERGVGRCAGWSFARVGDVASWVNDDFLSALPPEPPATRTAAPTSPTSTATPSLAVPPSPARLVVSPTGYDFGVVSPGEVASMSLSIEAEGGGPVTIHRVYFAESGGVAAAAGQLLLTGCSGSTPCEDVVTFVPTTAGTYVVTIVIEHSAGLPVHVQIRAAAQSQFDSLAAQECAKYKNAYLAALAEGAAQLYLGFLKTKIDEWC